MKNIKKLLSIVMVLAMVLALGVSALAATIEIDDAEDMGLSYDAWQIFAGSTGQTSTTTTKADGPFAGDENAQLGDIDWGAAIKGYETEYLAALKAAGFTPVTQDAKGVAELLGKVADSSADANKFAEATYNFLKSNNIGATMTLEKKTTDVASGYWLIVEQDFTGNKVINPALLQLTNEGNVTIKKKADIPTVDKTVTDVNDSTGAAPTEGDSADYDVGDSIPYTLTATLGTGYDLFESYYLQFVDTMSDGLTYNGDARVYIGKTDVTAAFEISPAVATAGAELTVTKKDLKNTTGLENQDVITALAGLTTGSTIVVKYTATLNDNAKVGPTGNENSVYLRYQRDPHNKGEGEPDHGKTEEDTVIVFTFDQKVIKVDGQDVPQPLEGAEFTLYKLDKSVTAATDGYVEIDGQWWKELKTVVVEGTDGKKNVFNFDRIDDGIYKLRETVTPPGYNTAADIDFEITAEHTDPDAVKAEGGSALTKFEVKLWNEKTQDYDLSCDGTFTITSEQKDVDGMISGQIVNDNGLELPETGGIGTTIFYVVGAILVAGAVILLVTRKRANDATK